MGRPKIISDADAIELVNQYFAGPCAGIASNLKFPGVAEYIQKNGYPDYRVETLRRSPAVRRHVESLIGTAGAQGRVKVTTFKPMDVEAMLDKNRTRASLIKALTEIDMYYKTLADTAAEVIKKEQKKDEEIAKLQSLVDEISREMDALRRSVSAMKEETQSLKSQNAALQKVVDKYVYPEIANVLLKKSGYKQLDTQHVDPERVIKDTITPSTKIEPESKIIEGLFRNFEE